MSYLSTQSRPNLYSRKNTRDWVEIQLIEFNYYITDTASYPHNRHLLVCCVLLISDLIQLLLPEFFCTAINRNSVYLFKYPRCKHFCLLNFILYHEILVQSFFFLFFNFIFWKSLTQNCSLVSCTTTFRCHYFPLCRPQVP